VLEHLSRDRGERDARGGLARARALEHRARIADTQLLTTREVGVPGPRVRRYGELVDRRVAIRDRERDRRADRDAETRAGDQLDRVALDLHAAAAAVAALPARE